MVDNVSHRVRSREVMRLTVYRNKMKGIEPMNDTITPADLLISISEKEKEIKVLRVKIKTIQADVERMKIEERTLRNNQAKQSELEKINDLGLDHKWIELGELGLSAREVVAIKNIMDGATFKMLGEELKVSLSRASEIHKSGLRKLKELKRMNMLSGFALELWDTLNEQ